MKKEIQKKQVVKRNVFGNIRYESADVTHIECSTEEFVKMLNAKKYEIIALERNQYSEQYFKLDSKYLIFNSEFGIDNGNYADSLINENLVEIIVKINDRDIRDDLQDFRVEKGITIQALSELLEVPKVTVEKWLLKERVPSDANIKKIDDLIYGSNIEKRSIISIPEEVLDKIIKNQPETIYLINNLRSKNNTAYVGAFEKQLADNVLTTKGGTYLSIKEVYNLSKCAAGLPYGEM